MFLAGFASWIAWTAVTVASPPAEDVRFTGLVRQGMREIVLLEFASGPGCRLVGGEECRGVRFVGREGETVTLLGKEGPFELELSDPLPRAGPAAPEGPAPPAAALDETAPPVVPEGVPGDTGLQAEAANPAPGAPRRFSRDAVRLRLPAELPRILSTSTVVPRIIGSEVAGLELIAFPMDTVLAETGLLPGDVLLSVNGREVRGIESLAVLIQRFQTAEELELLVERRGELVPLALIFH